MEICVSGSNLRMESTTSSSHSMRIGKDACHEKTSMMPPRIANCPRVDTCATRSYPALINFSPASSKTTLSPFASETTDFAKARADGTSCAH